MNHEDVLNNFLLKLYSILPHSMLSPYIKVAISVDWISVH